MFKEKFIEVCSERGVSPTSVCIAVGLSNATYTQWSETSTPRRTTLIKICDHLNLPYDYFDETKIEPTVIPNDGLNPKVQKVIRLLETKDIPDDVVDFILKGLEKYKK